MLLRRYKVTELKQVEVKPTGNVNEGGGTKKDSKAGKKKAEM